MSVLIRQLGKSDARVYRDIRLEALKLFPEAYGTTHGEALARTLSTFVKAIENSALFGAFVGEQLGGIVCFMESSGVQDSHIGHLYQMYVRQENHRTGLGSGLIDALVKHANTRVKQIYLGVGTENFSALALYKKCGFEIYGTEPRALCIKGRYIDEHLMVKFLDQKDRT